MYSVGTHPDFFSSSLQPAINNFAGHGVRTVPPAKGATAGIFCTFPQAFLPKASQFFSEFIASTLLIFVIFALKDEGNVGGAKSAGNWFPLSLFFLIFGLGACFGYETGCVAVSVFLASFSVY